MPRVCFLSLDYMYAFCMAKDFLISELRPNLSSPHLVKALLHRLDGKSTFGVVVKQLKAIVKQMDNISNNIFDIDTELHLVNLIWSMRALKDTPHVIKTDLINECHSDVNKMNAINEYRCGSIVSSEMQSRILSALIHMSFNRIFGMNRTQEQRLMVFAKILLCEIIARMGSDIKEES